MKISIALATYNGAAYLGEQLASLVDQDRRPDEIVVCDDGSSDDTLQILSAFAQAAPFPVRIFENEQNLGYALNFARAISLCTGDIIFLSDQDDVWFPTKISTVEQQFLHNESTFVVVNNAEIADEKLQKTGLTVSGQLLSAGNTTDQLLLGCCIAFRARLTPLVLPVPHEIHGHDGWINTLGATLKVRVFLQDVLQLYRRHGANTSDAITTRVKKASRWKRFSAQIRPSKLSQDPRQASAGRLVHLKTVRDRIANHSAFLSKILPGEIDIQAIIDDLQRQIKLNESRLIIQERARGLRLISALRFYTSGGYRFFEGWKSLARDVLW